ncbi:MAG: methyltransferase domain-containing protein [Alphaproteobacteria bacterium]|nr:MAG: methyltransferase domain-containing protein [Alphaproteobacteria bacterium]
MSAKAFLKKYLISPLSIGSVVPSSKHVGMAFAKNIDLSKDGVILEIGAGTGTITKSLIDCGIPRNRIVCLEIEEAFCDLLRKRFNGVEVICSDILNLRELVHKIGKINCFVSTLPFISLGKDQTDKILNILKPFVDSGTTYLQMSYSPFFVGKSRKRGLQTKRCGYVWKNFPPAYIYKSI